VAFADNKRAETPVCHAFVRHILCRRVSLERERAGGRDLQGTAVVAPG
jgi:hypothetical protein